MPCFMIIWQGFPDIHSQVEKEGKPINLCIKEKKSKFVETCPDSMTCSLAPISPEYKAR